MSRKATGEAIRDGARAGRRPAPISRRRADPGAGPADLAALVEAGAAAAGAFGGAARQRGGRSCCLIGGSLYYNAQLRESVRKAQAAEQAARRSEQLDHEGAQRACLRSAGPTGKDGRNPRAAKGAARHGPRRARPGRALNAEAAAPDLSRAVAHQKLGDIFRQVGRNDEASRQYEFSRDLAAQAGRGLAARPGDRASAWHARTPGSPSFASMPIDPRMPSNIACRSCCSPRRTPRSTRTEARRGPRCSRPISGSAGRTVSTATSIRPRSGSARWRASPSDGLPTSPANVLARDQLATSHRKIADVRKLAGDHVAARAEYVKAVELGRELLAAEPDQSRRQAASRAGTRRPGDDASAGSACSRKLRRSSEQAEQLFTELVEADPEDVDNRVRLYQTQYQPRLSRDGPAPAGSRDGSSPASARRSDRARSRRKARRPAPRQGAATPAVRDRAGRLRGTRGVAGRPERVAIDAAARGCIACCAFKPGCCSAAGQPGDLPAAAEALCAMDARDPEDLYQLGRSLAWCAGRIDQLAASRRALAEASRSCASELAERAVAAVEQAASAGLGHLDRLEIDGFLAPIREHAGFRKLSESLRTASSGSGTSPNRDSRSATTQTRKP